MARRKNWKDGLQQAIIDKGNEETALAVQVEGATFEIPGGLNVQLDHDGANPDSVQVGDGTDILGVNADGSINVNVVSSADTTPAIFNVSAAVAGTEYSQVLPANSKKFVLKSREKATIKLSYTNGTSGTNYITIPPGAVFEDNNFYLAQTLYFQSNKNGDTIEIIAYT